MQFHQLPTFEQAEAAWNSGKATPLDSFIYDNEPFDNNFKFREELTAVLNWAQAKALEEDEDARRNHAFTVYNGLKNNTDVLLAELQPKGWNKRLDKQISTIHAQMKKLRDIVAPNASVKVGDTLSAKQ